jgi:polar amino acid transport system substrate-binding protein
MRWLLLVLLWCLLPVMVAAQGRADAADLLPARYRQAAVLRWGADAEGGAPFVYADPDRPDAEIGFEVDLAAAIADCLGVAMQRVQAPYEHLVPVLDRGDIDLVLNGFEPTAARRRLVRFTRPYYLFAQQLVVGAAHAGVTTLAGLAGQRVGVLGQSQSHQLLLAMPELLPVVYESSVTAYEDVVQSRTAAALADLPIAVALRPLFPGLVFAGPPFGEFPYCMAVRRSEPDLQLALDAAIAALWQDGSLERIYRRWGLWTDAQSQLATSTAPQLEDATTNLDWAVAVSLLGGGALRTLVLSVLAFGLAAALGLAVALLRLHGLRPLRWCAVAYTELLRGTPVLVQLLLLYYGLGQFESLRLSAFAAGVLGLGLNYAAYEAEVYRGALQAIPRGQREAAAALGLSTTQALRHVILPQALRLSLPASTNDFIALFKDSSIVMVITVVELTKQYQMLANASGQFISLGLLTCAFYLGMSLPLAWLARRFELRLERDRA